MSYTKLFSSILDSTIWREGDHVIRVWIAMLAMKDADGVVDASLPGLADRARKTIEETEDALRILSSPDRYSRTKDHEGRRIEEVENGWRVLNHDKYRAMESVEDKRERKTRRQARWRENREASTARLQASTVDAGRPKKTHVSVSASGSASPDLIPSSSGASGTGAGEIAYRPPGEVPDGPAIRPAAECAAAPPPMSSEAKMLWPIRQRLHELRERLAEELKLDRPRFPHPTPEDERDALARLRESGDPVGDLDAVFAQVEADARASSPPSLEFVSWSMFRAKSWGRKLSKHGATAAPRAAPLAAGRVEPKPAEKMDKRAPWEIPAAEVEAERQRVAAERSRK